VTDPAAVLRRRSRRQSRPASRARRRVAGAAEQFSGWAFVTPGAVIILLFGAVPIVWSAIMSFQRSNLLSPSTPYVGLSNYRRLVHDPIVSQAIQHTPSSIRCCSCPARCWSACSWRWP
jgi:ABC-type sugar transport system permease subunit